MASIKMTLDVEAVKEWLEKADMVSVIRCKDCKHWCKEKDDGDYGHCKRYDHYARTDCYCSYGERREK